MLLVEISVPKWPAFVSPPMVGFEVCVLFQAHQQDRSAFCGTDLFLCGLWLSSRSCSIAKEQWGQAKGRLHGCLSQHVHRQPRAAEHIVFTQQTAGPKGQLSLTTHHLPLIGMRFTHVKYLVQKIGMGERTSLLTSTYFSWHYTVIQCGSNFHFLNF